MFKSITLLLAGAASVQAACDNQCSGHGTCMVDDVCNCYDNWGVGLSMDSGDCSDRICPFDIAWVDTPNAEGEVHNYAECSGKGICDRGSGMCECFDGYEGKACQRTTCPNDCSGHGTCEYIEDMAFSTVWNHFQEKDFQSYPKQLAYYEWDKTKTRGCVCDAQYTDVDCSKRQCPHGNDVIDVRDNLLADDDDQKQRIVFSEDASVYAGGIDGEARPDRGQDQRNRNAQTFALTFRSRLNESFTTYPIRFDVDFATDADSLRDFRDDVHLALLSLPNQIIDACVVSVSGSYPTITLDVTFTGDAVQGRQNLLVVEDFECSDGCTPKITGLALKTRTSTFSSWSGVSETVDSVQNTYECGRRGKCDYDSGLCQCFEGYTGENCNEQTTLV